MAAPIAFEPPSIQKAWQAFLQHIPVVLVSWVGSIVLSLLAVLAYGLIIVAVSAILGSSDAALGLGAVLAQLVQLPFSILASLLSVLLVAVPALYYERGEVVTISTAAQLLTGRWWRYVLAGLFFSLVPPPGFLLWIPPGVGAGVGAPGVGDCIFVTHMGIGGGLSPAVGGVMCGRGCSFRWSPPSAFCFASSPGLPWRW